MNMRRQRLLEGLNPWWGRPDTPVRPVKPYRRRAHRRLLESVLRFGAPKWRAILLEGLRQVGKSTLAWQVLASAREAGVEGHQVAWVPVEDPRFTGSLTVDEVLECWAPYLDRSRPAILVLDEVHRLGDPSGRGASTWVRQLKAIVDRVDAGEFRIQVLATGSAAGELRDAAGAMVGRLDTFPVDVLSFAEFRELRTHPDRPLPEEVFLDLDAYLTSGGFPEHAPRYSSSGEATLDRIRRDTASALAEDLRDVRSLDDVRRLFSILMDISGEELNEQNLSKSLPASKESVRSWIARMEEVHMIQRVPRWATSRLREIRGRPKVYGVAPGIVSAYAGVRDPLGNEKLVGRLVEAAVLAHLRPFARSRGARILCLQERDEEAGRTLGEADFLVEARNASYIVEATSGTTNLERKIAFLGRQAKALAAGSRGADVHAMVTFRGTSRREGEVPCIPLHEFLEALSGDPDGDALRRIHRGGEG